MIDPITILVVLVFLSVLVFVHELGHFLVAKKTGVWVEEFGIGIPPRIWGKKIGNTLYSINALPLGGFVKLHGETDEGKTKYPKRAFVNKSAKARILISIAGIVMNILFAAFCFSVIYTFSGIPKVRDLGYVLIEDVRADTPAFNASFVPGDKVLKVNGKAIKTNEEFISAITSNGDRQARVEVKRKDQSVVLYVTPKIEKDDKGVERAMIGVVVTSKEQYLYYPPFILRPLYGVYYGLGDTWFYSRETVSGLFRIVGQLLSGVVPKDVGGPVVIVAITAQAAKSGFGPLLSLAGIISLNLAFFNLIPFPPLDGSRVLIIFLEKISKKKLRANWESKIYTVGMMILLLLVVLLTYRELPKLISAGSFSKFIDSLMK